VSIDYQGHPRFSADDVWHVFGSGQDSRVGYDGTNDEWTVQTKDTGGTQRDRVKVGGNVAVTTFELYNSDAGATGAQLDVHHDSASPAASDTLLDVRIYGDDTAGNKTQYAGITAVIVDPSAASEDGRLDLKVAQAASLATVLQLNAYGINTPDGQGAVIGHPTQVNVGALSEFQVLGTASADSSGIYARYSADNGGPRLQFFKSRNATIGSNTIVQDDDIGGDLSWRVDDGSDNSTQLGLIRVEVDDSTPAASSVGGALVVMLGEGLAGDDIREVARIAANGHMGVGRSDPAVRGDFYLNDANNDTVLDVLRLTHMTTGTTGDGIGVGLSFNSERSSGGTEVQVGSIDAVLTDVSADSGDFVFSTRLSGTVTEAVRITSNGDLLVANGGGFVVGHPSQITGWALTETQILGTAATDGGLTLGTWATGANSVIQFIRSQNTTIGSSTIVNDNDIIGQLLYLADDGGDFANIAADFMVRVDDASPAANDVGTEFVWRNQPGGGGALAEAMNLRASGILALLVSADSAAVADEVSFSRYEIGAGNTVLGISQETAVAADTDETKFSNKLQVRINGATYFVMLTTT